MNIYADSLHEVTCLLSSAGQNEKSERVKEQYFFLHVEKPNASLRFRVRHSSLMSLLTLGGLSSAQINQS